MKKIRNRIAAVATALAVVGGASLVAAAPAQAATTYYKYWWMGLGRCAQVKVVDYSWAEEFFQNKRDSTTIVGYMDPAWCRLGV